MNEDKYCGEDFAFISQKAYMPFIGEGTGGTANMETYTLTKGRSPANPRCKNTTLFQLSALHLAAAFLWAPGVPVSKVCRR